MGPRRMDGFARPTGAQQPGPRPRPVDMAQQRVAPPPPPPRPIQRPVQRPVSPQERGGYPEQMAARVEAAPQLKQAKPVREKGKRPGWQVALQFVIGLVVIIGVAAAIVALYMRYYQ